MTIKTTDNGQIVKAKPSAMQVREADLRKMLPQFKMALPKAFDAERMLRITLTALRKTPALASCTPGSFFASVISAAQLGLEVNTPMGHAYLIPYKTECTLVIGYKGFIDLAYRSGRVQSIYGHAVKNGDEFDYSFGLAPNLIHIPSKDPARDSVGDGSNITHAYAVAKIKEADPAFQVLTKAQIERFRNRSASANNGPWVTDYEPMAVKTAIRRLITFVPQAAELARAAAIDEAGERGAMAQLGAMSEEIVDVLQKEGMVETIDATTGEVIEEPKAS